MPVIYNGYCRPLKAKVDFEVSEVNSLDTAKGIMASKRKAWRTQHFSICI